jgi:hypothetical protein
MFTARLEIVPLPLTKHVGSTHIVVTGAISRLVTSRRTCDTNRRANPQEDRRTARMKIPSVRVTLGRPMSWTSCQPSAPERVELRLDLGAKGIVVDFGELAAPQLRSSASILARTRSTWSASMSEARSRCGRSGPVARWKRGSPTCPLAHRCEIFGVVRFSTFSTASSISGRHISASTVAFNAGKNCATDKRRPP